jgi:hypothetical protein
MTCSKTAAALIVVLALPLLSPFLPAEANLPACCRGHGRHHCVMRLAMAWSYSGQGDTLRTPALYCPFHKALTPVALYPARSKVQVFAAVVSSPIIHLRTGLDRWITKSRSHQLRAPPTLPC